MPVSLQLGPRIRDPCSGTLVETRMTVIVPSLTVSFAELVVHGIAQ